jgi:hypothetical protein
VDGQALTPSSFTETDTATGQLVPLTYAGSYGINGFYLPFGNSATVAELGFNTKTTAQDYPYWPVNTLLINSSSANGAQNNTFLDSSTNNFTITRAGNTTQGRFGPFEPGGGTEQTASYFSGYFDGTGDYLSGPTNNAVSTFTGNFTIEGWFYFNSIAELEGIFFPREQLLSDTKYEVVKQYIPELKKKFSSTFMTSLQKKAETIQKWPLLNLIRQILLVYNYHLTPIRKCDGYTPDGVKKYKRFFKIVRKIKINQDKSMNIVITDNE